MRPATSPRRHPIRWVLFVSVALGLAAMHTLGHAGMDHTMSASMRHQAMVVPQPTSAAGHGTVPEHSALDAIAPAGAQLSAPAGTGGMPGGTWSMCLAIVGCVVLLLMPPWLYRRPRAHDTHLAGTARAIRRPRGPPPPHLCLVTTSVIRR